MRPKFTIVITSENEERFLACYKNCLDQLYPNFEIIVVSSKIDQSVLQHVNTERADQKHVIFMTKFITLPHGMEIPGYYRNTGIVYATGDYLIFLDDNQEIDTFYFEFIANEIEKSVIIPDLVFVNSSIEDENGVVTKTDIKNDKINIARIKMKTTDEKIPSCCFVVAKWCAELNPWTLTPFDPRPTIDFLSKALQRAIEIKVVEKNLGKVHYIKDSHEEKVMDIISTMSNTSQNAINL